jgi:Rrf2 family nitric oxide-sensitive transcriptional repressor
VRGKNGGLRLNGHAEDINIGSLVRDTEQDLALVECFTDSTNCTITPACHLKIVFAEALEAFFKVLDEYSLADLLPKHKQSALIKLLGIQ